MTTKQERINAAFSEAARTLGVSSRPQTEGRRAGPLNSESTPESPECNPYVGGLVEGNRVEIINHSESYEKGTMHLTRCTAVFPAPVLPANGYTRHHGGSLTTDQKDGACRKRQGRVSPGVLRDPALT